MERPADRPTETGLDPGGEDAAGDRDLAAVPDWDDEFIDRVSDRLMHNYDLEKDYRVAGEDFTLYGRLSVVNQKHVFHPALSFAGHESTEHLFVTHVDAVDDRTLGHFADLGSELADEWIEADEEHFATEFTFVLVTPSIPDPADVRRRIEAVDGRTLLKYGYHGHYEINIVVVAPASEALVASENADVASAFRLWEPIEREEPGLLRLISRRFQL
ncbi:hypothetical protein [Natrialba sp. PRR66]|uniref:hypothetical protein n=1 Tax=Natrialba sp. PRR66 TaxID=3098146 RepID=UPI002B1E08DF|nr:hypothetical protein [Natrialba sp. PRR66]